MWEEGGGSPQRNIFNHDCTPLNADGCCLRSYMGHFIAGAVGDRKMFLDGQFKQVAAHTLVIADLHCLQMVDSH